MDQNHNDEPTKKPQETLIYRPNDIPVWYKAIPLAIQQMMVGMAAIFVPPYIVSEAICAGSATAAIRAKLISTAFVITGVGTILQSTVGIRLSDFQGPAFSFFGTLYAFSSLPQYKCNATMYDFVPEEEYLNKMQLISGSLVCGSILPMLLGLTGLIGIIAKRCGPITICPIIILLCVDNFLLSMVITYIISAILTVTDSESPEGHARIDKKHVVEILQKSSWIQIPYPGQFGAPKFNLGLFVSFFMVFLSTSMNVIGNYIVLAKVSEHKAPPSYVINRSVFLEGFGSILAAFMGLGVGLITFSENIAAISITRNASRFVMQLAGFIMILLGVFTKIGAGIATIPEPMVGGILGMAMCIILGVAFTILEDVDLKNSRNLTILGISIMCALYIPSYIERMPIVTGFEDFDQMTNMLLNVRMILGGFITFILDNIVPGATLEQRGFRTKEQNMVLYDVGKSAYAYPVFVNKLLLKVPMLARMPFMPAIKQIKEDIKEGIE